MSSAKLKTVELVWLCRAIAAAHAAEPAMKALGSWQRKAILMHCVEQFKARKDELAMSLCIEAGKPIKVEPVHTLLVGEWVAHVFKHNMTSMVVSVIL